MMIMHSMAMSNEFIIWLVHENGNQSLFTLPQNHLTTKTDIDGPSLHVTSSSSGRIPPPTSGFVSWGLVENLASNNIVFEFGSYEHVNPTVNLNQDFGDALLKHFESPPPTNANAPPTDAPSSNVPLTNTNAPPTNAPSNVVSPLSTPPREFAKIMIETGTLEPVGYRYIMNIDKSHWDNTYIPLSSTLFQADIDGWIELSAKNKSTEKELVDLSSRHGYGTYPFVVAVVQMRSTANGHRVMTDSSCFNQYKDIWNTTVSVKIKVGDKIETVQFFHCYKRGVDRVFLDQHIFLEKVWGKTASKVYGL
ncbi:hypothetical protein GIB67_031351 [Kingdonia uniflora]|uniref:Uncharacterized protein n=1 Tax=Kingdonia uniflora TaxID=39325 RepID=A0A7J7MSQ0_9MAGN|nr:hypothetical protein GIB67_031351 [Kingdonia uniflora]